MIGSLFAFLLLCLSAVLISYVVIWLKLRKRTVMAVVALSFVGFTVWALFDGVAALHSAE